MLNWNRRNHRILNRFFQTNQSPGWAVFDWDNTCIFGDIGDAFFRWQVFQLDFRLNAAGMDRLIPTRIGRITDLTHAGNSFSLSFIKEQILGNYSALIKARLKPGRSSRNASYRDYLFYFLFLHEGLLQSPEIGYSFTYPWVVRFLAGFSPAEIKMRAKGIASRQRRRLIRWRSISDADGRHRCGWLEGLRIYPEMKNLIRFLRELGFRVAIVTASHPDIVAGMAEGAGFVVDRLVGMSSRRRPNFGTGKVSNIRRFLDRPPIFVAGDSNSDYEMLTAFPETGLRLLVYRGLRGRIERLYRKAAQADSGFLLQGIDPHKGCFSRQRSMVEMKHERIV